MEIFFHSSAFAFLALFPILNPPAMSPIFLEMTSRLNERDRNKMAFLIGKYSFFMLAVIFLGGSWLLKIFGISIPVIRIAGGLLLFNTAWKMLNEHPKISDKEKAGYEIKMENAFFPMTLPVTAGPGSIAITLSMAPQASFFSPELLPSVFGIMTGIFFSSLCVYVFYRNSQKIISHMDETMRQTISKISAFILLAIAVQITTDGLASIFSR